MIEFSLFFGGKLMIQSRPKPTVDRRQIILGAVAAGAVAASAVQALPAIRVRAIHLHFPKGAPVPPWLEVTTKPGFFGIPVEVFEEHIPETEQMAFARMGYRDVPETRLRVRAVAPMEMQVGDCLIRYRDGCARGFRALFAAKQPYQGRIWWSHLQEPPGTWMWTHDGPDLLFFARVAEPDFHVVNDRLAERVSHSMGGCVIVTRY